MVSKDIQLKGEKQYDEQLQRTIKKLDKFYQDSIKQAAEALRPLDDKQVDTHLQTKLKSFNEYWERAKKEKVRVKQLEALAQSVGYFDPNVHIVVTKDQLDITKQIQSLTSIAKQIDDLHRASMQTDIKEEVKQAFTEVLNPPKKAKKLTPTEQFEQDVKDRSKSRILQAVKKAAKK